MYDLSTLSRVTLNSIYDAVPICGLEKEHKLLRMLFYELPDCHLIKLRDVCKIVGTRDQVLTFTLRYNL